MADEYEQALWDVYNAYLEGNLDSCAIPQDEKVLTMLQKTIDCLNVLIVLARESLTSEIVEHDWFDQVTIAVEREWLEAFIKNLMQQRDALNVQFTQRVLARLLCHKIAGSERRKH